MAKSNKVIPKKKRGRPATGKHPLTALRLPQDLTTAIGKWAADQDDAPNRSEAIRRLVELGLSVKPNLKQPPAAVAARAKELAAKAIDDMSDNKASADDQSHRKRRLLKGPEEFRDSRVDRAKVKP